MFLPVPPELRDLAPPVSAMPPPMMPAPLRAKPAEPIHPIQPHPHNPKRYVRMFPACAGDAAASPRHEDRPDDLVARRRADLYAAEKAKVLGRGPRVSPSRWFEDPIAIGTLLLVLPPVGLAAVWSSKRYSNDARWALTVVTGLMMFLAGAVALALVLRR